MDFEEQLAAGQAVPVDGWDFSWFAGHATEERPSWGYSGLLAAALGSAAASLDIETGGGEVYSRALRAAERLPDRIAATESWPPNLAIARRNLEPLGATVAHVDDAAPLPFDAGAFDLVVSRLPEITPWAEISRVLAPGGTFLSQQVVHGTNRELYEFMMGPQPIDTVPAAERLRAGAEDVGLEVLDVQQESLRVEFFDVESVVVFLRKVIWTVPDFSVEKYRDRLEALYDHIAEHGSFLSQSRRALIVARKP
ncbi:MAG: class SAM-dependent methyltransferase [Rhodoglobus sp.]|nr:class SAM-dependent methyltransferase [Rhodoglobus sp.]